MSLISRKMAWLSLPKSCPKLTFLSHRSHLIILILLVQDEDEVKENLLAHLIMDMILASHESVIMEAIEAAIKAEATVFKAIPGKLEGLTRSLPNAIPSLPSAL